MSSSVWSERYRGYELAIEIFKTDDLGLSLFKNEDIDIAKFLDEPHALASRKAYKAVSIYMKLENDVAVLKKIYFPIVKNCLKGGVTNRFTYRYAVRIICQMFEKLSNVDDLNRTILYSLQEDGKLEKTLLGLLSLLNFFTCKYGPEKIDTLMFIDEIGKHAVHRSSKVRTEALKFFVLVANWKGNTDSIKTVACKVLEAPQFDLLDKMLQNVDKVEDINFDEWLQDSEDDAWYNKEGYKVNREEQLNIKLPEGVKIKFGPVFVHSVTSNYRWVDRVSKLDEVIFDLVWNKVIKEELPYLARLISEMLNSYNMNVLIKTLKLLCLLILKFKEEFKPHIKDIRDALLKSLDNNKPMFLIEVSKTYYYLSKYCLNPVEYLSLLIEGINHSKGVKACKLQVEILVTFLDDTKPSLEVLAEVPDFVSTIENLSMRKPATFAEFAGTILVCLKDIYSESFEQLMSPALLDLYNSLNEGRLKRFSNLKSMMINRCFLGIDSIKREYEPKDISLFEEGYESFDQLSEETSSQCSSDYDFIDKEEIPEDIFIDIGEQQYDDKPKGSENCIIF